MIDLLAAKNRVLNLVENAARLESCEVAEGSEPTARSMPKTIRTFCRAGRARDIHGEVRKARTIDPRTKLSSIDQI